MLPSKVTQGPMLDQGDARDPISFYTRVFTRFLQVIFGSFPSGSYKWNADDSMTEIIIQGDTRTIAISQERRPAVIVAMGGLSATNVAMNQFAGPLLDENTGQYTPNYDGTTGRKRHVDLVSATVVLNIQSSSSVEAQRIAWTCSAQIRALQTSLRRAGIHKVGDNIDISPPSSPGSVVAADPTEVFVVPVMVPFFFLDAWSTEPVDKTLLREVDLALTSVAGIVQETKIVKNS